MRGKSKLIRIGALSIMVAAMVALGMAGQPSDAQAQVAGKSVSNVQLGHNGDYHLTITWDAPGLSPRDYRVMWAKVDESYRTWTDTSGNAFPATTSHTATNVERGQEYKIKVRARYNNGSGPWSAEAQYTIPAEPPPANDDPPANEDTAPTRKAGSMPEHIGILDWTEIDGALRYEIEVQVGQEWSDITGTDASDGTRAFMNGSSAIIAVGVQGSEYIIRVRAMLDNDETTDWMVVGVRID